MNATREPDLFKREILTVSELTRRLSGLIEAEFGQVWLSGEISNLRRPSSGHFYLTIKDEAAQVRAVMFRTQQRYLAFKPQDGHEVLVRGRLSVYEPRGEYQIVIDYMEPRGEGALRLAFEKLKAALAAEGLFDPDRKKPLPYLPQRVAVVTSPTGAAVRDFIDVARRRWDNCRIAVYPVRVQGEGAAEEIAAALRTINGWGGFDVIVLTRGGGSLEDLWAFNEEVTVRAAAESVIPVVSAVGHEVDFSITDFAADLRAPTPSAAAELVFREKQELAAHLLRTNRRMHAAVKGRTMIVRERLAHLGSRLGDPARLMSDVRLRLDDRAEDLTAAARRGLDERARRLEALRARLRPMSPQRRVEADRRRLADMKRRLLRMRKAIPAAGRERLAGAVRRLEDLSPLAVLQRGYSLTRTADGAVVRSVGQVSPGDRLDVNLSRGLLEVIVDEVKE